MLKGKGVIPTFIVTRTYQYLPKSATCTTSLLKMNETVHLKNTCALTDFLLSLSKYIYRPTVFWYETLG